MPFSHHSHSGRFCRHGHGDLESVVQIAISKGFHTYGLSEHMPRFRQRDLYADEEGLTPADLERMFDDFVNEARRLQIAYADKINLLVGCESDFIYAEFAEEVQKLRERHNLDYFVGSVHHALEIPIDFSRELFDQAVVAAGGHDQLFEIYYDAQYAMLQALQPPVVGHFDLIKMYVPTIPYTPKVLACIDRNINLINGYGGLIELNSRAFKKNLPSPYPMLDVLQRMLKAGSRFTLSDDCHGPNDVGMHYDQLYQYLVEHQITNVYYLSRDNGHVSAVYQPNILTHNFFTTK